MPKLLAQNICALAVMIKAPQAGDSKTRLVPPLTALEAASLSACFLRDTCENIERHRPAGRSRGVAVYTPVGSEAVIERLLPASFELLSQRGNRFGERLFHAAEDLLSSGYDSFCLIDSDSPTLPGAFLRAAVAALAAPGDRVVLGPAEDGGYYLIGLKTAHRTLFEEIDWSTSRVLRQTIACANEIKLPVTVLPTWFDVDDASALRQLCDELFVTKGKPEQSAPVAYKAPHTRAYLSALLGTEERRRRILPLVTFSQMSGRETERCDLRIE